MQAIDTMFVTSNYGAKKDFHRVGGGGKAVFGEKKRRTKKETRD
jgi:hypothetical protein